MPTLQSTLFSLKNSEPTNNICMVLNTDGTTMLGIGTNTPASALDVTGTTSHTGATTFTAPASWKTGGGTTAWANFVSSLTGAQTTNQDVVTNTMTFSALSADYAGSIQAHNAVLNTDTSAFNYTGILRAHIAHVNVQSVGATVNQIEANAGVLATTAGSTGTITFCYATGGEFNHSSTSLTVTECNALWSTCAALSSGNFGTGVGVHGSCTTTSGQTGSFTTSAIGVRGQVTHVNAQTLALAWGMWATIQSTGTSSAITTGGGLYVKLRGNTTGTWANAYGVLVDTWVNSTAAVTKNWGMRINNQGGSATVNTVGMFIVDQSGSTTGNVALAVGSSASPNGSYSVFVNSANATAINAPFTVGGTTAPGAGVQTILTQAVATSGTPVLLRLTGQAHTGLTIAETISVDLSLTQTVTFGAAGSQIATQRAMRLAPPTYSAASGTQDFATLAAFDIANAPNTTAALTTVGNVFGLMVGISGTSVANKAATVYGTMAAPAQAITLLNTTQVTSTVGATMLQLGQLTVNQSGGAVTMDQVATLDIVGPPIAGSSVTLTNIWSMIVRSGNVNLGGLISKYNAIALDGNGVPSIVRRTRPAQQTNTTVTLATYTCPASDGTYEISANVNVTTSTTVTMTVTCAYTDETNVARTLTLPFLILAGTWVASITTAQGNIPYESPVLKIRCKASTSITIATAGTVTSVVYTGEGTIKQTA